MSETSCRFYEHEELLQKLVTETAVTRDVSERALDAATYTRDAAKRLVEQLQRMQAEHRLLKKEVRLVAAGRVWAPTVAIIASICAVLIACEALLFSVQAMQARETLVVPSGITRVVYR